MIDLPNPFEEFDSEPDEGSDTAAASNHAPVPGAAVDSLAVLDAAWRAGNDNSVSDDVVQGSLPSGESEPAVTLALAPSDSLPESTVHPANDDRGQLAAGAASLPAPAAFSIDESALLPVTQVTTAGDTGDHGALVAIHDASSPADFAKPSIPYDALQSKNRFDEYFDPNWFMAEIDEPPVFLKSKG